MEVLAAGLTTTFLCCREVASRLVSEGGGVILLVIADNAGDDLHLIDATCNASVAGLITLIRCFAIELGPSGVRANVFIPPSDAARSVSARRALCERTTTPLVSRGPEWSTDALGPAFFLLSDDASFVSGTIIDSRSSVHHDSGVMLGGPT